MLKHIIGQTVYQLIILLILIFNGDNFLPEYKDQLDYKLQSENLPESIKYNGDYMRSGRKYYCNESETNDFQEIENANFF